VIVSVSVIEPSAASVVDVLPSEMLPLGKASEAAEGATTLVMGGQLPVVELADWKTVQATA
jgi:hypothetical protein